MIIPFFTDVNVKKYYICKFYVLILKIADMINRNSYINKLIKLRDKQIIKVITGIRRSGKSTLLLQYIDYLKSDGVNDDRIIYLNLESAKYDFIRNYHDLYAYINQKIGSKELHYVIIDEIQNVSGFERAVNSLTIDFNVDLYLTGSNANMLSSELATLLSGRYVEIRMLPLAFYEYYQVCDNDSKEDAFYRYLKYGGFPFLAKENDDDIITSYLDGIYNTIILKDVVKRNSVKDISLMEKILKMILSSIGSPISSSSIVKVLKNEQRNVSNETIDKYLSMFESAYIIDRTIRYDVKGKGYLKTLGKCYVADIGLRNYILGYRQIEPSQAIENIVYMELLRRGYKVDTGKIGDNEIDFVARKQDVIEYYQVSYTVNNSNETLMREIRPFNSISDHYSCYLLTMDRDFVTDIDGIRKLYLIDWLLNDKSN